MPTFSSVERQNELFHNGDRPTTLTTQDADKQVRGLTGGSPHLIYSLVQMDNPDHFAHRKLTQAWFLPQNIKKLEDGHPRRSRAQPSTRWRRPWTAPATSPRTSPSSIRCA